jgi:hypothetical protein
MNRNTLGFFMTMFVDTRCKWFGHKWEYRQVSIGSFSSIEIFDEYYSCKNCGEVQTAEEWKINERDSKINQILD